MMVTDITIPDDKNNNWQTIAGYLLNSTEGQYVPYKEKLFSAAAILTLFDQFFIVSEDEKAPVAILDGYLRYVNDDADTIKVISDYIHMDAVEENKQAIVDALCHVLLKLSDD